MLGMIISRASTTFRVLGPWIKVKVTVAIFRKTLPSLKHLYLLMDFNINLHTNVGYDNISSVRLSGSWAQGQGHCGYF